MPKKYTYLKTVYGRNAGRTKASRWFRLDSAGRIIYIEKREAIDSPVSPMYKIGNLYSLMWPGSNAFPAMPLNLRKCTPKL